MEHPVSFNAKFAWLREHFPDIPATRCIFCGDTSVIGADYHQHCLRSARKEGTPAQRNCWHSGWHMQMLRL